MELLFICLKIFFVRIIDVSLATTRTIVMVKGKSLIASLIGLIEVFIWFMIVKEALNYDGGGVFVGISYSLGFAVGTFMGSFLANKYIDGNLGLEVITGKKELALKIRENGFAVSVLEAKGQGDRDKFMLVIEIRKKSLAELRKLISDIDKDAFVMVRETKIVHNGYFK